MQAFTRRGFQLRTASLETRIAYTGFLVLLVPGIVTLVALSAGRMGLDPRAIAAYYRGGESEMSFPKGFWQLMEVSHFHLFSIPVVLLVLSHLLYATPLSLRLRVALTLGAYAGGALEVAGPWAVRYLSAGFAYLVVAGWAMLAVSLSLIIGLTLAFMWGPLRWVARASLGGGEDRP